MTYTLSQIANAATGQMFAALTNILKKAADHAAEKGVDESVYLNWRLAPDMLPMIRQPQIACDIAARGLSRLAGADIPSFTDDEKSFAELIERVGKAHAVIQGLSADDIDADPTAEIVFPVGKENMTLSRHAYVQNMILPNVYFHTTTAYGILRSCGVPLGKMDFLKGA